jgi:hypothetical protein
MSNFQHYLEAVGKTTAFNKNKNLFDEDGDIIKTAYFEFTPGPNTEDGFDCFTYDDSTITLFKVSTMCEARSNASLDKIKEMSSLSIMKYQTSLLSLIKQMDTTQKISLVTLTEKQIKQLGSLFIDWVNLSKFKSTSIDGYILGEDDNKLKEKIKKLFGTNTKIEFSYNEY